MDSDYPPLPSSSRGAPGPIRQAWEPLPKPKANNADAPPPSTSSSEELQKSISKQRNFKLGDVPEPPHHHPPSNNPSRRRGASVNVISSNGDVIIEYTDRDGDGDGHGDGDAFPSAAVSNGMRGHRWLVASEDLTKNSPYFRALLDPNKFSEGRQFMKQKTDWSRKTAATAAAGRHHQQQQQKTNNKKKNSAKRSSSSPPPSHKEKDYLLSDLPTLSLPVDESTCKLGVDAIELFLRVLSFQSLHDDKKKRDFNTEIKFLPSSLVARLVEIADAFNSPQAVREALKRSGYAYGKGRVPVSKFNQSLLKMSEDRIRQIIYIAHFLEQSAVLQVLTHTLLVVGSRYWVNGVEPPDPDTSTFRWLYFTDGLEEELYYRRQCVMNTITDLQAYFLRAYGALEESSGPNPTTTSLPMTVPATSTANRPREFQCRCGFGNSNACDAFHLGQMIRFFALRTKTIFLGSSLLDSDFGAESEQEDEGGDDEDADHDGYAAGQQRQYTPTPTPTTTSTPAGPPADITAIIASLKQFPDYQIDSNHTGCGVRRRIIPALDFIERFIGDSRGLLGVYISRGKNNYKEKASMSWTDRLRPRAQRVDIRFSKLSTIHYANPNMPRSNSQEEDARLVFTAKKRHWEA